MIITGGNTVELDISDAWIITDRVDRVDGAAARAFTRRIVRKIARTALGRRLKLEISSYELELVLVAMCDTHTAVEKRA